MRSAELRSADARSPNRGEPPVMASTGARSRLRATSSKTEPDARFSTDGLRDRRPPGRERAAPEAPATRDFDARPRRSMPDEMRLMELARMLPRFGGARLGPGVGAST